MLCRPIERMWQSVDVKFKTFARREAPPSVAAAGDAASAAALRDQLRVEPEPERPFDPLRDHALDEALGIERAPPSPTPTPTPPSSSSSSSSSAARPDGGADAQGSSKGKKATKPTKPTKTTKATKATKARSVAANREIAKRVQAECVDATRPIKLVHGLSILGRGDVLKKREWKIPAGDAQVVDAEGALGIDGLRAAQLERSLQYAKHANRPRIICESVEQYRLAAR